jgi:hypothetical protein
MPAAGAFAPRVHSREPGWSKSVIFQRGVATERTAARQPLSRIQVRAVSRASELEGREQTEPSELTPDSPVRAVVAVGAART